ncbi:hypothetical protein FIBSPDRAFT_887184 [Athelia psychrophila]|uniref:Uncharacterized protein n=1 Tax=Athelia psychrophila TaxID=1759441 RepID=A0A166Q2R8_9AGAM|nr:hypothetical protein FIBSPDRAFT_887184 [Fibularhizoctonia sp. CBS 109695]
MHTDGGGYKALCPLSSWAGAVYSLQLQYKGYASLIAFNYPILSTAAVRVRPTPSSLIENLFNTHIHPSATNISTSTIDNILTLQMMVLQSVPSEELQDDLEDDVDFITDTRSDQSDHSSETSTSAAELLKFEQSSGDHCNVVMIQTQQHVDHITKQILPHLQSLVSPAMDGPLTRTSGVEELESTLIFTPTGNHQLSSSSFGQPSGLLPPVVRSNKHSALSNLMLPSPEARHIRKFFGTTLYESRVEYKVDIEEDQMTPAFGVIASGRRDGAPAGCHVSRI